MTRRSPILLLGLALLLALLPSMAPSQAAHRQTPLLDPGYGICPVTLAAGGTTWTLEEGGGGPGFDDREAWDVQFSLRCGYTDGAEHLSATLGWVEDPYPIPLPSCDEPPGFHEADGGGFVYRPAGTQAEVHLGESSGEVPGGVLESLAERLVERGAPYIAACSSTQPFTVASACPSAAGTARWDRGGEVLEAPAVLDEAEVEGSGISQVKLTCRYAMDFDGDVKRYSASATVYLDHTSKRGRQMLRDSAGRCQAEQGDRWQAGGWIRVSAFDDERYDLSGDRVGGPLLGALRGWAAPCSPREPTSLLLNAFRPTSTAEIQGFVAAMDQDGRMVPMREANVTVRFHRGASLEAAPVAVATGTTDAFGGYQASTLVPTEAHTYSVSAELRDDGGAFLVRTGVSLPDEPVHVISGPHRIAEDMVLDRYLTANAFFGTELSREHMSLTGRLDETNLFPQFGHEAALVFAHTARAETVRELHFPFEMDHELPVNVVVRAPAPAGMADPRTHYVGATATVNILHEDASPDTEDAPWNREYHEYGHHVATDSRLGGEDRGLRTGGSNHGGLANADSSDSMSEGFAEFFGAKAFGNGSYKVGDGWFHLETDTWSHPEQATYEEFDVASLLWDLIDETNEPGDGFTLETGTLWALMTSEDRLPIQTVRDLYLALEAGYGDRESDPATPLSDLDELFVKHRFWDDADGDKEHDPGEAVGWAGYGNRAPTHPGDASRRHAIGVGYDAFLFPVTGPDGLALDATAYEIRFEGEGVHAGILHARPAADGLLHIGLPGQFERLHVTPVVPGYRAQTVTIEAADVESALRSARDPEATLLKAPIQAQPVDLSAPAGLTATSTPGGVELAWQPAEGATATVIVASLGGPVDDPEAGVTVHRGAGSSSLHETAAGARVHYTAFSLGPEGQLSSPVTTLATHERHLTAAEEATARTAMAEAAGIPARPEGGESGSPAPGLGWWAVVGLAGALALARGRRAG